MTIQPSDGYAGIRANGHTWDGHAWLPDVVAEPYETNGIIVVIAALSAIFTIGYTLPWAIAAGRNMPNQAAIGMLNVAFGWTVLGWFVTLIMACTQKRA